LIHRATQSIVHRGPDQQGVFESDTVSLGAVRLRIIDLAGGRQPMHAGGCVIVFNGEVYNHAEIREELIAKGHQFESKCDTEAVLRAFLEWDTASFQKLRGMFAFAIWDESQKRLVLCRDRMGIKPLYLYEHGEDLYFGSELKTLFALPGVERRLDAEGLSHYLSLNWVPAPFTLAEGIRKLDPGEWLEWIDGRITQRKRYWTLQFEPNDRMRYAAAREELDSLLRASMREHLVSDVPLGIWASGGIDSSTVLHYAAEAAGRKLQTFSVSFQGRKFDESPYFREIAEKYGTDHHEFDLNPEQDLGDAIEQLTHYSDEPSADAGALPVWFLSKMTRRHVTVSLSGEGADELFGGYETYKADNYAAVARLFPAVARRMGLAVARLLPVSDEKIGFEYKAKRFLAGTLQSPVAAHLYWNGTFSQPEKERLMSRNGFPATGSYVDSRTPETHAFANRAMWIDQLHYLPDDILYKCDRMSMAHSLEVRPPFLDHRIVEFAARLPQRFKIRGSKLKFILKDLMRDKLPPGILNRPKQGFDIPTHHWLRTSLKPLFMDTVNRQSIEATGVVQWREVERVIEDHMNRKANYGYHLWGLLMLCSWMKRWSVNASR
jgi:asparagine synthase (glutamine-hydrolysing)